MISKILPITENKLKILTELFINEELNLATISKNIGMAPSNITGILVDLEPVLDVKAMGRIKLYSINCDYISFLKTIIERYRLENNLGINLGFVEMIKKMPELDGLFVFGSYAKGKNNKDSDLDLIIITENKNKIKDDIRKIKKLSSISIEIIYMDKEKYRDILDSGFGRFYNILTDFKQRIEVF